MRLGRPSRDPGAGGIRPPAPARTAATLATVAAVLAAVPAIASGAGGATTLALNGPAADSLRASGVRIAPLRPATGGPRRLVLPIAAGLAGAETTLLRHRGGIALRSPGGRAVRLKKLRLLLGKRSRLSATLGGREVDLFKVGGGSRSVDPSAGAVTLSGARLKLTRAGARAIAAQLEPSKERRLRHSGHAPRHDATAKPSLQVKAGRFGALSTRASNLTEGGAGSPPPVGGGAAGSSGCPLPSGAGPAPESPLPVAARPPAAVDVSGATIEWHVRESFIRYIGTGEGTSVSGGATADPPVQLPGTSAALSYTFHFPFAEGWHDAGASPADPADDTAAIEFGGATRFLYSGHGIDLTTATPEIELAGGKSRAIFAISEGGGAAERQVLVNLDLGRAAAIRASGSSYTYERIPAAIPSGTASSVFGDFYAPGTEFGCFSVSFSAGS